VISGEEPNNVDGRLNRYVSGLEVRPVQPKFGLESNYNLITRKAFTARSEIVKFIKTSPCDIMACLAERAAIQITGSTDGL
jgi:hypothetical protein